ncbi:MAG: tetratricopeptide repeat protein [Candidatus Omnitrophota bacterium]|nr:MAG: tetratricopeptide repeat protein [Candidatus Omnitrophota bacterium]
MNKYTILIIILLSFLIYGNSLNNEFVSDDIPAIVNNPVLSDLFSRLDPNSFLYALNYAVAGLNPWIYHVTSIILHIITSILVFFFLRLFFKQWPSLWGALIFTVHPVHTEAVTWISGRGYVLFSLFLLASFLLYVRATASSKLRVGDFLGSFIFFICAVYSATVALLYLGMLVLYDFTFGKWRKNYKYWTVFFAFGIFKVLSITSLIGQRIAQVSADIGPSGDVNFIFNMAFSVFSHLGLLLWPARLTLYHENLTVSAPAMGVGVFFLCLLFLLLPILFKKAKVLFFAFMVFILFLSPTYSPVTITWLVAERYLYFPSIALSMGLAFFIERVSAAGKVKVSGSILLIALLAAGSVRTVIRNFDWASHASIWRATVRVSPQSAKAHNNMGDVYCLEGNLEKAVEEFRRAIELKADYADAYHNLAHTYQQMGRVKEAVVNYKKAVAINKNLYQSYRNLGVIYLKEKNFELAEKYFKKVMEIKPGDQQIKQVIDRLAASRRR